MSSLFILLLIVLIVAIATFFIIKVEKDSYDKKIVLTKKLCKIVAICSAIGILVFFVISLFYP